MDDRPGTSHPTRREIVSSRVALKIVLEDADLLVADKLAWDKDRLIQKRAHATGIGGLFGGADAIDIRSRDRRV
jgi:hypothetical protein